MKHSFKLSRSRVAIKHVTESKQTPQHWAIVPAAGIGSRVGASIPKQYININAKTVIEHTLGKLVDCKVISKIVVALSKDDDIFNSLTSVKSLPIETVEGGRDRCDSVLAGLEYLKTIASDNDWVLVHDAARPCIEINDIHRMIAKLDNHEVGGILGVPVRDTMKRVVDNNGIKEISKTESRDNLWHALTPQMFRLDTLYQAMLKCRENNVSVTDEASAIEYVGLKPVMIEGSANNIKITQAEDLQLAELYLKQQSLHIDSDSR